MLRDICVVENFKIYFHDKKSMFVFQEYDPLADRRPQKIADREDEYKAIRRRMIISPERYDPFAEGRYSQMMSMFTVTDHKMTLSVLFV